MSVSARSAGSYARAIVQVLERVREAPVVMSSRDFQYVSDWHARGVPLPLIVESIEAAAAPRRGRAKGPRKITLAYVAPSVEEAWGVVLAGRTVGPVERRARSVAPAATRARWHEAARKAGDASALARLVARILQGLDEGLDAAALDRAFDAELVEASPAAMLREVEAQVDAELAGFADFAAMATKMSRPELLATRRRAIVDRLRRRLALPRLADGRS